MKQYLKKLIHQIIDKWLIGVATAVILTFGSAILGSIKVFVSMPDEIEYLKQLHVQDSTRAAQFIFDNNERLLKIEAKADIHDNQILNNQKASQIIKTKLKIR